MEDFDFPAPSIPLNLLNSIVMGVDREIGDQLPFNFLTALRRVSLGSMNDCQVQSGVAFLFTNWRQNTDFPVSDLESRE